MQLHQWKNLVADGSVRGLKYSFGLGVANCMAARLDDGTWLVVSPAMGVPAAALDDLAKDGEVSALVANNGFHHMGQAAWRKRFPQAVSYAPTGSLPRLTKKATGVTFRPLDELRAKLPDRISLLEPDGQKSPDLLACVNTTAGAVWFTGDLISNTVHAEMKAVPRFIFTMLGGGPGYRFNPVPAIVYLADKPAWKAAVRALVAKKPPVVVLPGHGDPIDTDAPARTLAILS